MYLAEKWKKDPIYQEFQICYSCYLIVLTVKINVWAPMFSVCDMRCL